MIVLVDLDGTLTDPAPGIISSIRHALETHGYPVPPASELGWTIGPPLRQTFSRLVRPGADVEQLVAAYRSVYGAGGLFDAEVYSGIDAALRDLKPKASRMLVCTAKPLPFARRVLEHFKLDEHFDGVYGPDMGGALDDKGDLIEHLLAVEKLEPVRAVMIGDRGSDVSAAKRHGIPTVGVLWGYGSRDELTTAGAAKLVAEPKDLVDAVEAVLRTTD
ncbi:putative phosphatase [Hyaloraphidium curvatum]|nr:putative phosphatase [Hyaloraphidium curvatum]